MQYNCLFYFLHISHLSFFTLTQFPTPTLASLSLSLSLFLTFSQSHSNYLFIYNRIKTYVAKQSFFIRKDAGAMQLFRHCAALR